MLENPGGKVHFLAFFRILSKFEVFQEKWGFFAKNYQKFLKIAENVDLVILHNILIKTIFFDHMLPIKLDLKFTILDKSKLFCFFVKIKWRHKMKI